MGQGPSLQTFACRSGGTGFGPGSAHGSLSQALCRRSGAGTRKFWSFDVVFFPSLAAALVLTSGSRVCARGATGLSPGSACEGTCDSVAAFGFVLTDESKDGEVGVE